MLGSIAVSYTWPGAKKGSTIGWMVRANSSNTRCWYCISVPNFAVWNRRSPFQSRVEVSAGTTVTGVSSHSFRNDTSPLAAVARTTALV
ncbi:hypothetical protein D3C87_1592430 [compost metagenome]